MLLKLGRQEVNTELFVGHFFESGHVEDRKC